MFILSKTILNILSNFIPHIIWTLMIKTPFVYKKKKKKKKKPHPREKQCL